MPVGVRGAHRAERFAAWLPGSGAGGVEPLELAARRPGALRRAADCRRARRARERREPHGSLGLGGAWGPLGSVGFELASGAATVTAASDLDLLLAFPPPAARSPSSTNGLSRFAVRTDLLLETPPAP